MNRHEKPSCCCSVPEEVEDGRLDGDVERRHRLVRDEEARRDAERPRQADALALPARELVRVAVAELGAQPDGVEELDDAPVQGGPAGEPVQPQRLADDLAARHPRVQRRVGVLEDDVDLAPVGPQPAPREARDVGAVDADRAAGRVEQARRRSSRPSSFRCRTRRRGRAPRRARSRTTRRRPPAPRARRRSRRARPRSASRARPPRAPADARPSSCRRHRHLAGMEARDEVVGPHRPQLGHLRAAELVGARAPVGERAGGRQLVQRRARGPGSPAVARAGRRPAAGSRRAGRSCTGAAGGRTARRRAPPPPCGRRT